MRVLLLAPNLGGDTTGEAYTAFKLIEAMADRARLTVMAYECAWGPTLAAQLPRCEVITFPQPGWTRNRGVFSTMLKPGIPVLNARIRAWLAAHRHRLDPSAPDGFDLAHQILPRAPRYATVLRHFALPYVIGSLGGALPTPAAFRAEAQSERWFTRLRGLDALRLRYDPWLRASYGRAALVLGVAPYMRDVLAPVPIRRFEPFLGIGVEGLAPETTRPAEPGRLRLLYVGRVVRTKGLRDAIRALGQLGDRPGVTLTAVGDGEDLAECRAEAARLGLRDRVTFTGRLPRAEIEAHYQGSDALIFPSFRESMGAVIYEAMRWGLPVITVRAGGPDWIVDDSSGLKAAVTTPEQLARDLAAHVALLADDPALRARLGAAGRARLAAEALWPAKAARMLGLYDSLLAKE
jgi:glycosyltransferase involved in cell wall biosynthesis